MDPLTLGLILMGMGVTLPDGSTKLIQEGRSLLNVPYIWGGTDPSVGLDCSGFTYVIHKRIGILIPRLVTEQYYEAPRRIPVGGSAALLWSEIRPGGMIGVDLDQTGRFTHVYLYAGNDRIIHSSGGPSCPCSSSRCKVVEDKLSEKNPKAWRGIYSYVNS